MKDRSSVASVGCAAAAAASDAAAAALEAKTLLAQSERLRGDLEAAEARAQEAAEDAAARVEINR